MIALTLNARIAQLVRRHGSLRAVGAVLGIDYAYLFRLKQGQKNNPSPKLLRKLGLRKVEIVYYEKIRS